MSRWKRTGVTKADAAMIISSLMGVVLMTELYYNSSKYYYYYFFFLNQAWIRSYAWYNSTKCLGLWAGTQQSNEAKKKKNLSNICSLFKCDFCCFFTTCSHTDLFIMYVYYRNHTSCNNQWLVKLRSSAIEEDLNSFISFLIGLQVRAEKSKRKGCPLSDTSTHFWKYESWLFPSFCIAYCVFFNNLKSQYPKVANKQGVLYIKITFGWLTAWIQNLQKHKKQQIFFVEHM